ncbi:MAG: hypothetical protein HY719_15885 [Planctomycetes bacterium]|nr:hypothetical protein [Planctomycetota bacterium]
MRIPSLLTLSTLLAPILALLAAKVAPGGGDPAIDPAPPTEAVASLLYRQEQERIFLGANDAKANAQLAAARAVTEFQTTWAGKPRAVKVARGSRTWKKGEAHPVTGATLPGDFTARYDEVVVTEEGREVARAAPRPEGMPFNAVSQIAPSVEGVWIVSEGKGGEGRGLALWRWSGENPAFVHYAGKRWLPSDAVTGLSPVTFTEPRRFLTANGRKFETVTLTHEDLLVGTEAGAARLTLRQGTLAGKDPVFEERVKKRHWRARRIFGRDSAVVASSGLGNPEDYGTNRMGDSDNDGLWTAMYCAAQCYRYTALSRLVESLQKSRPEWEKGAPADLAAFDEYARARAAERDDALASARVSFNGVAALNEVTGVPGYPARSWWPANDRGGRGHTGPFDHVTNKKWKEVPGEGILWKGDTSSDETDGHYYIFGVYYNHVGRGAQSTADDRTRPVKYARAMTDHLMKNDWYLVDEEGLVTHWGIFSPRTVNEHKFHPEAEKWNGAGRRPYIDVWLEKHPWWVETGLKSASTLGYLRTTAHLARAEGDVAGADRYEAEYQRLVRDHGYARNTVRQKVVSPRSEVNFSDTELHYVAMHALMMYADPAAPEYRWLVAGMQRLFDISRSDKTPLWNFIYAAANRLPRGEGAKFDLPGALETLRAVPLDCRGWKVHNEGRWDLPLAASPDRHNDPQARRAVDPRERSMMKYNGNPYETGGGGDGRGEDDGSFWLLSYWMGRAHGYVD